MLAVSREVFHDGGMEDQPVVKPKRRLGVAQGQFVIPDSFFEPLPDEILNAFYESEIFPPLVKVNGAENDEADIKEDSPR